MHFPLHLQSIFFCFCLIFIPQSVMAEGTLKKDDPLLVANREAVVLIKVTGTSLDGTTDPRRGTGFVINENGYILTAGHVVGNHFSWRNTSGDFSDLTGLQREVWVRRFNKQTKKLEPVKVRVQNNRRPF